MSAVLFGAVPPLGAWQNFYVIIGSSAGALIGLTFVVISIAADRTGIASSTARLSGLRAFITPTAVHFGSSLWLAALASVPGQTLGTLAICLALSGLAGVGYCATVIHWMLRLGANYRPFLSDWVWNVVLPSLAYAGLLAAAALMLQHGAGALYLISAITLLLLFIGIHNAWDVVTWITTERHTHGARQGAAAEPPASSPPAREQTPKDR